MSSLRESRFDRVVRLLCHRLSSVREEASRQLSTFAILASRESRVVELSNLLKRIDSILVGTVNTVDEKSTDDRCSAWNVRVTVAGLLSEFASAIEPNALSPTNDDEADINRSRQAFLSVATLDLQTLLSKGLPLFGSSGDEYNNFPVVDGETEFERQRRALLSWLGQELVSQQKKVRTVQKKNTITDNMTNSGSESSDDESEASKKTRKLVCNDVDKLITREDIRNPNPTPKRPKSPKSPQSPQSSNPIPLQTNVEVENDIIVQSNQTKHSSSKISSRLRNKDRREARQKIRNERYEILVRGVEIQIPATNTNPNNSSVDETKETKEKSNENSNDFDFSLLFFCSRLRARLLSASWEARHGAAIACTFSS